MSYEARYGRYLTLCHTSIEVNYMALVNEQKDNHETGR